MYVEKSLDRSEVLELVGCFGVFGSKVGDFARSDSPELVLASERLFGQNVSVLGGEERESLGWVDEFRDKFVNIECLRVIQLAFGLFLCIYY